MFIRAPASNCDLQWAINDLRFFDLSALYLTDNAVMQQAESKQLKQELAQQPGQTFSLLGLKQDKLLLRLPAKLGLINVECCLIGYESTILYTLYYILLYKL